MSGETNKNERGPESPLFQEKLFIEEKTVDFICEGMLYYEVVVFGVGVPKNAGNCRQSKAGKEDLT